MTIRATILSCLTFVFLASVSAEAAPDPMPTKIVNGAVFGPTSSLQGVYFTNFENSTFIECADETSCHDWASKDGAWVNCDHEACADLDRRIKALSGNHDKEGTFAITFLGRRAAKKHPKRFLNDREDGVLIERIVEFKPIQARPTRG